ncbi:hypothetical protein IWQ60_001895 [Tieghemiomyces parasiticus]|uniref:START domain-containing protein n=1 Tax=Tieghemiomyces parasiticus TaxID=78921 RepID=A0A9W8E241_9FUNG|nr:hypothetical protein IWQ60_001895 [Tieghemiomyces parasiticus]
MADLRPAVQPSIVIDSVTIPPTLALAVLILAPIPTLYTLNTSLLQYPLDSIHYALFQLIFIIAIPALLHGLLGCVDGTVPRVSSREKSLTAVTEPKPEAAAASTTSSRSTDTAPLAPDAPETSRRASVQAHSNLPTNSLLRNSVAVVVPSQVIQPTVLAPPRPPSPVPVATATLAPPTVPDKTPRPRTPPVIKKERRQVIKPTRPVAPPHRYTAQCAQMKAELLQLVDKTSGDKTVWNPILDRQDPFPLQVYQKCGADLGFKMEAVLNSTAATAFDLLADATRRPTWDDMCDTVRVIEALDGAPDLATATPDNPLATTRIQYVRTKPVWPTSARDVVLLSLNCRLDDGRYMSVTQSVSHPDCPEYKDEGYVRMSAGVSGQIVTPLPVADGQGPRCRVIQIADGNPGGWIPQSVVRFVATKAMPQSFVKVAKQIEKLPPQSESNLLPPPTTETPELSEDDVSTEAVVQVEPASLSSPAPSTVNLAPKEPDDSLTQDSDTLVTDLLAMTDAPLDDPTWKLIFDQTTPRLLRVYQKVGSPYCFKTIGILENSPYTVFDLTADVARRPEWDELCAEARVLKDLDADRYTPPRTRLQYIRTKPIWPTSSRDMCVFAHNRALPNGRLMTVSRSVDDPAATFPGVDCPAANQHGNVRMQVDIAGLVISPEPPLTTVDADGRPMTLARCRMVQILNGDPQGWIPKSVTTYVATKAVPATLKSLNETMRRLPVQTASALLPSTAPLPHPVTPAEPTSPITPAPTPPLSAAEPSPASPASSATALVKPVAQSGPLVTTRAQHADLARRFTSEELVDKIISLENRIVKITEENNSLLRKALEIDTSSDHSQTLTKRGIRSMFGKWTWVKPFLRWIGPLVAASIWTLVLPRWSRRL